MSLPRTPLLLEPLLVERPWGGRRLVERFGKSPPPDAPPGARFGESWELSDHPAGASRIASGTHRGAKFGALVREYPKELLGVPQAPARYPLLLKFIDAAENLSVQVHPADGFALLPPGERGKSEAWFVMEAEGGEMVLGTRPGEGEGGFARERISAGDMVLIPPGTVHALLGGSLVCEIQQASDTTYRLWDWGRLPARELHLEQAARCIVSPLPPGAGVLRPTATEGGAVVAAENPFFRVRVVRGPGRLEASIAVGGLIAVCVAGRSRIEYADGSTDLVAGATAFVPHHCGAARIETGSGGRVLLVESRELGNAGG